MLLAFAVALLGVGGIIPAIIGLPPLSQPLGALPTPTPAAYTVTVTPSAGPTMTTQIFGVDSTIQKSLVNPILWSSLVTAGVTGVRFPSDRTEYWHCYNDSTRSGACNQNSTGMSGTPCALHTDSGSTFQAVMALAAAAGIIVNISANYGTSLDCTNGVGGDPTEAAGWLNYCQTTWAGQCPMVTIGSEDYHACNPYYASTPPCAANALNLRANLNCNISGSLGACGALYGTVFNAYYSDLHAAAVAALSVCALAFPQGASDWDTQAKANITSGPDCIELEYYPQTPGNENDLKVMTVYPQGFTDQVNIAKARWGSAIPIYVDQIATVSHNPGKQPYSITSALFQGQIYGEAANDGIVRLSWHTGFGVNCKTSGNFSTSLYGWQAPPYTSSGIGDSSIFSLNDTSDCPTQTAPYGTLVAGAFVMQVAEQYVHNGEHVVSASEGGPDSYVRPYAATYGSGYALMLFNLNLWSANVVVTITGKSSGTGGTTLTYGKKQYDDSNGCETCWTAPVSGTFGSWSGNFTITLPPWSMSAVQVN